MVRVSEQVFATGAVNISAPISDAAARHENRENSRVSGVFALDVIDYVDTITSNLLTLAECSDLRAATWVKALLETEMRNCISEGDGLRAEFLQACVLVATDRLRQASADALANAPVPFELTPAGLAAIQDGGQ